MATLTPRDRRLAAELGNMRKLEKDSPYVRFKAPPGDSPEEYEVTYSCFGLVDAPDPGWGQGGLRPGWRRHFPRSVGDQHVAQIELPADYPIAPPRIRFTTPVFHPNLKHLTRDELDRILGDQFGGIARVRHALKADPELREKMRRFLATYICLDGISLPSEGGAYAPRVTLYDICCELGQMIMLQRYNLSDPLDQMAAEWTRWAEKQKNLLPIDNREFLGNLEPAITVVGSQGSSGPDQQEGFEITVLSGEEA